ISAIMELVNTMYGGAYQPGALDTGALQVESENPYPPAALLASVQRDLVLLLAPFAPYLAHELWEMLGEKENLLKAPWPKYDAGLAKEEELEIPVQINGKLRGKIVVPADSREDFVIERALGDEKVQSPIGGRQVVKTIYVSGKLLNFVVR